MKRDMDLVRDLMLEIEAFNGNALRRDYLPLKPRFAEVDKHVLDFHIHLLEGAGFIKMWPYDEMSKSSWVIKHLTWDGCEFLETVRDDEVWKTTKSGAKTVGNFGLQTILEIGKGIVAKKAEDWLASQF